MNKVLNITCLMVGIISCTNSLASELYKCTNNTHVRNVWLDYPTAQPIPCSVVYEKPTEDGSRRTLWEAKSKTGFCEEKASELLANLGKGGWDCSKVSAKSGSKQSAIPKYLPLQAIEKTQKGVLLRIVSPILMIDVNGRTVEFKAKVKKAGCLNGKDIEYEGVIGINKHTGTYMSVLSEKSKPPTENQLLHVRLYCIDYENCERGHGLIEIWGKTGRDGLERLGQYESVFISEILDAGVQEDDDAQEMDINKASDLGGARPGDDVAEQLLELDRLSCAFGLIDESVNEEPEKPVHSVLANAQYEVV